MKIEKYLKKYSSLENKTVVVTGANAGLGYNLSKHLLSLKTNLIMACRSLERANKAKDTLLEEFPDANIRVIIYDQADFSSIRNFVKILQEEKIVLDGLVCNAGVYFPKKKMVTKDGFELTIGTNYFGLTYLLDLLENKLIKEQTRVVIVSSLTGTMSKNHPLEKIDSLSRNQLYGFSKYLISTSTYQRMVENKYPLVLVHPGVCSTNILNNKDTGLSSTFALWGRKFLNIFVHSAYKASLTLLEGLMCPYKQYLYIAPRGLFAISGYPKIKKVPKKFQKEDVLNPTRSYIKEKKDVTSE